MAGVLKFYLYIYAIASKYIALCLQGDEGIDQVGRLQREEIDHRGMPRHEQIDQKGIRESCVTLLSKTIFVGRLPWDITQHDIYQLLQDYGKVSFINHVMYS